MRKIVAGVGGDGNDNLETMQEKSVEKEPEYLVPEYRAKWLNAFPDV